MQIPRSLVAIVVFLPLTGSLFSGSLAPSSAVFRCAPGPASSLGQTRRGIQMSMVQGVGRGDTSAGKHEEDYQAPLPKTGALRRFAARLRVRSNALRLPADDGSPGRVGVRNQLRKRIASIRDSQRLASIRKLLRNSTAWDEEMLGSASDSGALSCVLPEKLMGSYRLARAIELLGGWRRLQKLQNESAATAPETAAGFDDVPVVELEEKRVQRMRHQLTRLVLEGNDDGLGELYSDQADVSMLSEEDQKYCLLIDEWTEAIAQAYGKPEPLSTHEEGGAMPVPLAAVALPSSLQTSPQHGAQPADAPTPRLEEWPEGETLRKWAAENPELAGVTEYDLRRFMVLKKGDASKTVATLLAWQNWLNGPGYGIDRVADVSTLSFGMKEQIQSGKCFLLNNRDVQNRPVVMVRVKRHDPSASSVDASTLFIAMCLKEADSRLSDPHPCHFSVVLDLGNASLSNIDYPLIKRLIYILTNFYPERLGVMLLHDAPSFFSSLCWPLIRPWLNPSTRSKIHFTRSTPTGGLSSPAAASAGAESRVAHWVGEECLPEAWGGRDAFDYDRALALGCDFCSLDALALDVYDS